MNLDLGKIREVTAEGVLAREVARMEDERVSWRHALVHSDSIARQMKEITQAGSAYGQVLRDIKALQFPASDIARECTGLLRAGCTAMETVKLWQEAQRVEQESVRRMLEPLADIRKSLMLDDSTQRLIKEITEGVSLRDLLDDILSQATGAGSAAKLWAQQIENSRVQARRLFDDQGVGNSIQNYVRDFEHVNGRWKVPSEVLDMVGSFKEIHDRLGKVALPTIDWDSAATLARLLGREGIEEQLALLGVEPDGTLRELAERPEKGLLSRKQADALAILSFLLTLWIFVYQEYNNSLQQPRTETFQAQTAAALQVQAQQIQSLTVLLEKALAQAAEEPETRFVVRERTATVRSKPENGATVAGKLLPNEVVRAVGKDGKWVEVEYYHWLHEEYRTGWVLKKYLERVPTNYSKDAR
jgi:hypothetical protein